MKGWGTLLVRKGVGDRHKLRDIKMTVTMKGRRRLHGTFYLNADIAGAG